MNMIKVYVLVSFYDDTGLHRAGTIAQVPEDEFNPLYMKKLPDVPTGSSDLADLDDVNLTDLDDGEILIYQSSTGKWINGVVPAGAESLSELDDVDVASAANGDVLTYDSTNDEWSAQAPTAGGIEATVIADAFDTTSTTEPSSYSSGTYIKHEGNTYKSVGTTGGTWDATKWSQQTITETPSYGAMVAAGALVYGDNGHLYKNKKTSDQWFSPASPDATNFTDLGYVDEYSETVTVYHSYAAGDFCTYEDKLYKCTSSTTGEAWDATKWTETPVMDNAGYLGNLNDVHLSSLTNNKVLTYESSSQKWKAKAAQSVPFPLDGLTDVDASSPTNGQVLTYDSTSSQWVPTTPSSGGGGNGFENLWLSIGFQAIINRGGASGFDAEDNQGNHLDFYTTMNNMTSHDKNYRLYDATMTQFVYPITVEEQYMLAYYLDSSQGGVPTLYLIIFEDDGNGGWVADPRRITLQ